MQKHLTLQQLTAIEVEIDEINMSLDIFDSSNPIEAQQIEYKLKILSDHIKTLKEDRDRSHLVLVS